MKPAQLFGLFIALALIVFVLTFALNYVGSSGKTTVDVDDPTRTEALNLSFDTNVLPKPISAVEAGPPLDVELHKPAWLDFWFENKNDKPVTVGVKGTSCTCAGVEIFLLPLGSGKAVGQENALEEKAKRTEFGKTTDEKIVVAPRQVGWVRVKWTGEKNTSSLKAVLWLNTKDLGSTAELEARVLFHPPVQLAQEGALLNFGKESPSRMPIKLDIEYWSATRDTLNMEAKLVGGRESVPEPVEVGEPVRLSEEDRQKLAERVKQKVRVAYRVPVTLRARTKEGKEIDAGPFRRHIELRLADPPGDPIVVDAVGSLLGDVQVSPGSINFQSFDRKEGSEYRPVNLQAARGVKLETDPVRTADFLEVELKESKEAPGSWQMMVRVKPNAANGKFPRENDPTAPEYRDTAVYLRPVNAPKARATRISVEGIATER